MKKIQNLFRDADGHLSWWRINWAILLFLVIFDGIIEPHLLGIHEADKIHWFK